VRLRFVFVSFPASTYPRFTAVFVTLSVFSLMDFFATGAGYATMTIVFLLDIYYCIIIAWTLFYLISTFTQLPDLPWQRCGESFGSELRLNSCVN
jgi:SNF family Na+-dependent transporter